MNVVDKIKAKAELLENLRATIDQFDKDHEEKISALKAERDQIQSELLADLRDVGLNSIKVANGTSYTRSVRKGVAIVTEPLALKWALANMAVRIDSRLVAQKLEKAAELPAGFERVESEFISIRKPKAKTDGQ